MPEAFDDNFDYLTLLGLNPATVAFQPIDEVHEAIRRKKKEWTGLAINPLYQQQARANLERAKQFARILDAPEALQAYLNYQVAVQAERREAQESVVAELLAHAIGSGRRVVTTGQWELLKAACDDRQVPPGVLDGLLEARRIRVVEDPPATGTTIPYQQPALDRAVLSQVNGHLRILGKASFYELVDLPVDSPPAKIVATAHILYDRWSKSLPKTSECVAWEKSLQACLTFLKDDDAKARYDRALFNRRLDEFLWRVDLALASGHFTKDDFVQVATVGVREFGLSNETVNQSVRLRAAARGLSMTKPVQMVVDTTGLEKCQRCFRYSPANERRCGQCGCEFDSVCHNPACAQRLSPQDKTCRHCGLKASRGVQYRELMRLADMLLNSGDAAGAQQACVVARRILASGEVERLLERCNSLRALAVSVRRAAAARRWSQVEHELPQLLALAPAFSQPGFPQVEQVAGYLARQRERLAQIPSETDAQAQADVCLEMLNRWTDSHELQSRLLNLAETLEAAGRHEPALAIVRRLAELSPEHSQLGERVSRLSQQAAEVREKSNAQARLLEGFRQAFAADRLYAADRLAGEIDQAGAAAQIASTLPTLRARLSRVRTELEAIREATARQAAPDELIDRHLDLLTNCRDCRESLAALQALQPAAPAPPLELRVRVQGTRRVLSWCAPAGGRPPTMYVIERSVQKPGTGRATESAWRTLGESIQMLFLDDEVLHSGAIVRYAVRAARRGTLAVGGSVLQEFSVASEPVFAEPLVLWQEALGLRTRVMPDRVELSWHTPAGARQVLVERWAGLRDDRPERADLLPTPAASRCVDAFESAAGPRCYRVWCVYDGPQGDMLTPGTIVSVVPGGPPVVEPVREPNSAAPGETAEISDIIEQAPEAVAVTENREANPLKRFGLWPPVSHTAE